MDLTKMKSFSGKLCGYLTPDGYFGKTSDGKWMMFETEEAYKNYMKEDQNGRD